MSDGIEVFKEQYPSLDSYWRYITTGKRIIVIGVGMNFMKKEDRRLIMRTGSNFTLREIRDKKPHMQHARSLAGNPELE